MRKKKQNEYERASRDFNSMSVMQKAYDRIIFQQINDDDLEVLNLVDKLKTGHPLVINFSQLEETAANKMLAFLTGATYALDGEFILIKEKSYLFARKIDFTDGSLHEFLEDL